MILLRRAGHLASIVTPIAVVLVVSCASARGEQAVEKPHEASASAAEREREKRDAEALALLEQIASDTAKSAAGNQTPQEPQDPYAGWIAGSAIVQGIAAVVIGFFTWRLVVLNRGLFNETAKSANAAKQSAEIAALTLKISQRAYLGVISVHFGPRNNEPTLFLRVMNTGHQPAQITARSSVLVINEPLPENPSVDRERFLIPLDVVIPAGEIRVVSGPFEATELTERSHWRELLEGTITLSVYGAIKYSAGLDILGETGFGFTYDHTDTRTHPEKRFSVITESGYNYQK